MTSLLWQAEDLLRAVNGHCSQSMSWAVSGVSIDSRTLAAGELFVALQGPEHDGHDHVAAALAAGAVAALVSRQPAGVSVDAPLVLVDDTFVALQQLGRAGRARAQGKIIGVTGSVGKTSTKEMLRLALSAVGSVYANPGSFNNHWGLPLALANLPPQAAFGVFEMGMNHTGEIAALTTMARPDFALITTIEAVHLEFFSSVEAIADAKAEIFLGMEVGGVAILNRDNPHFSRLVECARARGIRKVLSFSCSEEADATLLDCALMETGSTVKAAILSDKVTYTLGAPGMHLVQNSLAVLLAAGSASRQLQACAAALAGYQPPEGRGVSQKLALAKGGEITLIDESYNASPAAVRAVLGVLARTKPAGEGRRILVLGDMRELGEAGPRLHAALAEDIVAAKIDSVYCCGELTKHLYDALPCERRGAHAEDSAVLAPVVAAAVRAGDVVTIKGSKSVKMGYVIKALQGVAKE